MRGREIVMAKPAIIVDRCLIAMRVRRTFGACRAAALEPADSQATATSLSFKIYFCGDHFSTLTPKTAVVGCWAEIAG
jgi:hypothetical protein